MKELGKPEAERLRAELEVQLLTSPRMLDVDALVERRWKRRPESVNAV
jgi:hypothetical protein